MTHNLSFKLLQVFSNVLSPPLAEIFDKSMSSGCVPQDWRDGNIAPIFKKGSKRDPGNYRPISLTSIPCKVMESIIKDQVVNHLVTNSLFAINFLLFIVGTKRFLARKKKFWSHVKERFRAPIVSDALAICDCWTSASRRRGRKL